MATKGKQVVKTAKKKSFAEITAFKKTYPIVYDGEVLFTLEELSARDKNQLRIKFLNWVSSLPEKVNNLPEDVSEETRKDITSLELEMIPTVLKIAMKSDVYDLEGLTDKEIVKVVQSCGEEISIQITHALDEIIMKDLQNVWDTIEAKAREGLNEDDENQYGEFETQE